MHAHVQYLFMLIYLYSDKGICILPCTFYLHIFNCKTVSLGSLLGEMIDHMVKKSQNALTPDRKVWIYSAHDQTIANMLMTLDLFKPHCPPYTATILIELRTNLKEQYFVTVQTLTNVYSMRNSLLITVNV